MVIFAKVLPFLKELPSMKNYQTAKFFLAIMEVIVNKSYILNAWFKLVIDFFQETNSFYAMLEVSFFFLINLAWIDFGKKNNHIGNNWCTFFKRIVITKILNLCYWISHNFCRLSTETLIWKFEYASPEKYCYVKVTAFCFIFM